METPRLKICGITRPEDAEHAVELGAWAIGLIFWPGSARRCDQGVAAGIARALKRRVEIAGVFYNAPLDRVIVTAENVGLTLVQLHGDEGPSYCAEVARRTGCRIVKAARVRLRADVMALRAFHVDFRMLDTGGGETPGGTGETWDWALAADAPRDVPLVLSGGLTPGNVAAAVAQVEPWGVDVASGVESAPGVKDPAKVEAFFDAVRGVAV